MVIPKFHTSIPIAVLAALALTITAPSHAATLYWDANGVTPGFTALPTGTWGTSAFWSTDVNGSSAGATTTTTSSDDVNFGTASSGFSTTASTVTISGTQNVKSITFGAGNTAALSFSGGTSLTLGSSSTITNNSASNLSINTQLAGTTGFTKAGTGALILSASNAGLTGGITITDGVLQASNAASINSVGAITIGTTAGKNAQLVLVTNSTIDNAITIGSGAGAIGTGAIQATGTNFTATLNGDITITAATNGGGHFGTTSTGLLDLKGRVTFTGGTVVQRIGNVIYSGSGSDYSTLAVSSVSSTNSLAKLGATNGLATNATLDLGTAVGTGTFDMAGFNQSLVGVSTTATGFGTSANASIANSSTTSNSTLTLTGPTASTFAGVIKDVTGAGNKTLALVVNGASQTLTGTNTYTGGTTVSAGTLTLGHATDTLANTGAVTVSGGTLALGANSDTVGAVTVSGGTVSGSTGVLTGTNYDLRSGTVSAILGGAGVVATKSTTGTVTLSGANTFTGGIIITDGILQANTAASINGVGAITIGTTAGKNAQLFLVTNSTIDNAITIGSGAGASGQGAIQANGTNFTATLNGDISITTGTNGGGHFGTTSTVVLDLKGKVTFTGGTVTQRSGNVIYSGSGSDYSTLSLNTSEAGISTVAKLGATDGLATGATLDLGHAVGTGTFDLAGFNQSLVGVSTTVSGTSANASIANSSTTSNSTLTLTGPTASTFAGVIKDVTGAGNKTLALVVNGASQTLTGTNTYTGGTTVSAGNLTLGHATDTLANTGAVTVSGGTLALGANSDTVGAVTVSGGTISGSTGVLTGSSYALQSGTVSGILGGTGVVATKSTSGTVTLSGANTYTGGTNISAGTLNFITGGLGTTGAVTFTGNSTLQYGSATTTDLSSRLAIGNGFTGTVDTNGNNVTFATGFGASGSGALTKIGNGTLSLNAANTYTGLTTVNAGTLSVGSGGSLASGNALTLGASGLATFANVSQTLGAVTNDNTTSNALNFTASSGTVTLASLSGAGNTTFGSLASIGTLSSGTVNLNGSTSAINTLNGGTVNLGSSTTLTVSDGTSAGTITGTGGSLTKTSSGTLTLIGANTYTGTTTVSAGTLTLHATSGVTLANTSAVVVASGATVSLGAANQINSSATLTLNGGTLAANGFSQTLGTLDLNASSALNLSGSAALVLADSSALDWNSATLSISNFSASTNSVRFGTTSGGLTSTQLGLFRFVEFGNSSARIDADGFILPLSTNYLNSDSTDLVIATAITGTTTVTQSGTGTTTLSGTNTSTGLATVTNSILVIGTEAGGNWAGNVTVGSSGILKGRGNIAGLVLVNPVGTYSPGNSPAIQNIGALTVNPGGFVTIELDGLTAGTGSGFHDKIVSAGAVTLNGGTLNAQTVFSGSTGYLPTIGAVHAVITGSALTGKFDTYDFSANPAGFSFLPEYTATAVNLYAIPTNYASAVAGLNSNQTQVGAALQSLRNSGIPFELDQRTTLDARSALFNGLKAKDAAGLRNAYDQLTPEKLTAWAATTFQSASILNSSLHQRSAEIRRYGPASVSLNGVATPAAAEDYSVETVIEDGVQYQIATAKPQKRVGYLASATGAFAAVDGSNDRFGSFSQTGAASGGVDYALNENQTVGLVVGQYLADTDFASSSGSARTTTNRVGSFYDYHNNGFFVNASVSGGFSNYNSKRKIAFLNQTASGETQGLSYGGQLATGYDFKVGYFIIGPTASVTYDHAQIDGFDETGSAADLRVGRQNADSFITKLGVHISRPFIANKIGWIPDLSLSASRQSFNPNSITAQLAAGGDTFKVKPQSGGSEYINPSASLSAILANGWTVRLSYDAILNPQSAEHRVNLSVGAGF